MQAQKNPRRTGAKRIKLELCLMLEFDDLAVPLPGQPVGQRHHAIFVMGTALDRNLPSVVAESNNPGTEQAPLTVVQVGLPVVSRRHSANGTLNRFHKLFAICVGAEVLIACRDLYRNLGHGFLRY
jgi:hypothetical protein